MKNVVQVVTNTTKRCCIKVTQKTNNPYSWKRITYYLLKHHSLSFSLVSSLYAYLWKFDKRQFSEMRQRFYLRQAFSYLRFAILTFQCQRFCNDESGERIKVKLL